jgi:hypothetical protein
VTKAALQCNNLHRAAETSDRTTFSLVNIFYLLFRLVTILCSRSKTDNKKTNEIIAIAHPFNETIPTCVKGRITS